MRLHDAWHIRLEAEREAKIKSLEEEIARLRLTDAEREAIGRASDTLRYLQADYGKTQTEQDAATLRGLLERMGGGG